MLAAVAARALFDSKAFCLSRCVCVCGWHCVCVCANVSIIFTLKYMHTHTDTDRQRQRHVRFQPCAFPVAWQIRFHGICHVQFLRRWICNNNSNSNNNSNNKNNILNFKLYNSELNNSPSLLSVCQLTHCEFNFECVLCIPLGVSPWGASTSSPHPAAKSTILRCYLRIIRGNWLAKDCQHFGI